MHILNQLVEIYRLIYKMNVLVNIFKNSNYINKNNNKLFI